MSESLQPHGLQPSRLLCPWDFPGKNTGVVCHFLLQGIFPTQGWNPRLLHWQVDSLPLSHQGSPRRNIACLMWLSTYPSLARGTQSRILLLQGQGGIWLQYSPHQDSVQSRLGGLGEALQRGGGGGVRIQDGHSLCLTCCLRQDLRRVDGPEAGTGLTSEG